MTNDTHQNMTTETNIERAKEFIHAFNTNSWDRLERTLSPQLQYAEVATKATADGSTAFIELCRGWKSIMSDCTGKITDAHGSGNTVILEITWSGTQTGTMQTPMGEHPPSGKFQTIQGVQILTVKENQITSIKNHFDLLSMLTQFGALG